MSWLRSVVSKAVVVGGENELTGSVRSYADSVVQHAGQAIVEGAKILQDRVGMRNFKSLSRTLKMLEEISISCRGLERIQLLRRWLVALRECDRQSERSTHGNEEKVHKQQQDFVEPIDSARSPSVMYYDFDLGGEPLNFRDVFLHSRALEGITLSMILEAPNVEEVYLLLEIFSLCLTGGKEVHKAVVSSIQDLSRVFLGYQDEALVKREELLEFAQGAISGLKINADLARIDAEVSSLQEKVSGVRETQLSSTEGPAETAERTTNALKEALAEVRLCSRLEALLLKKKSLNNGDSPEIHAKKVDKLKTLAESLANSISKDEKRISDHRHQREEAFKFRVAKANEVGETEKVLEVEIAKLETQRDDLEAELKKVKISLAAARARLDNIREETDQFDEASNQIVAHLQTKEDELFRSCASCRSEAYVLDTWINFLEDTWVLQLLYREQKEKQVNDELERYGESFINLVTHYLSVYKDELGPSISRIRKFVDNLKILTRGSELLYGVAGESVKAVDPRKNLEEEYLEYETKIVTTFSVVDKMKEQLYARYGKSSRKDDQKFRDLLDSIEKLREEFDSIERPILEIETPSPREEESPTDRLENTLSPTSAQTSHIILPSPAVTVQTLLSKNDGPSKSVKAEELLDPEAELAKLESEIGNVSRDYTEEIGGWEFDELENELRSGDFGDK